MEPTTDLSGTWSFSRSEAPAPNYVRADEELVTAPNPAGVYSGVRLGSDTPPPLAPAPGTAEPVLTWTGFQRDEGSSRVFFQFTAVPRFELKQKGRLVTVILPGAKPNVRNNIRHLDLRFFPTPVQRVLVKRRKGGLEARVWLKREVVPAARVEQGPGGYHHLVLEFAAEVGSASAPSQP